MENFKIYNAGVYMGEAVAADPETASVIVFQSEFKRHYEAVECNGPNHGMAAERSTLYGNGGLNLDHYAEVFIGETRVAVVEMREIRPE